MHCANNCKLRTFLCRLILRKDRAHQKLPDPPYGGAEIYFGGLFLIDHCDHHRVKYFCEAVGFKYHLGYPLGVPRPPLPLTPLYPYTGGPYGGARGGMSEGGDIMSLTPKCDLFLESP